ncbi:MAG TPA: hypothetical protein VGM56_17630 [Byssovorax sp.]|jgi:hypothetical protein
MRVPGRGKFLVKVEEPDQRHERGTAATVIGMAVLQAVGYFTPCEQIVYLRRSVLALTPGLQSKSNFEAERPFDEAALDRVLAGTPKRAGRARVSASAWLPGQAIGPARYLGTREDDPNDVIPHEDRREIRAMRLVAAWLDRWDAREENSLDAWMADDPRRGADSSPGHVVHYQLDTSEAIGGEWGNDWWTPTRSGSAARTSSTGVTSRVTSRRSGRAGGRGTRWSERRATSCSASWMWRTSTRRAGSLSIRTLRSTG